MTIQNQRLIATCAAGLESLLHEELFALGAQTPLKKRGVVEFEGTLETAYRACLWSRFGGRIFLPIGGWEAPDVQALYGGAFAVDWESHLSPDDTFSVACTAFASPIQQTHYAALKVKDAIADRFRDRFDRRPSVRLERPDLRIHLHLDRDWAEIRIDLSGESLHRRGYRKGGGEAPLKENLAAAVLRLSGWPEGGDEDLTLIDPMCGGGTLLIEAALMAGGIAPGLGRDYFGFLGWRHHDPTLWERLVSEAREKRSQGLARTWPRIMGYDADRSTVREALENIFQAGLKGRVHVERRDIAWFDDPAAMKKRGGRGGTGFVVVNPPYGERLGSQNAVPYLYRCLGRKLRNGVPGWRAGVLSAHRELTAELRMNPVERYSLYNGPLPCELQVFTIPQTTSRPLGRWKPVGEVSSEGSEDFGNRLRKNMKRLEKWVEKEHILCYRIYDGDIPEYNVSVDFYEQWIHVQEYAPPKTVDPLKAAARLKQVVRTLQDVLKVGSERIFLKVRSRQKGKSQYQKQDEIGRFFEVREGPCRFLVNLSDYLDAGLFLDHRNARTMIREGAKGSRFLNLFGYTGSATVHAAMGGAKSSVTVDTSPVYLEWARRNLALNGFGEENHRFVQADCSLWLSTTREQFDLIFLDPPTFSNSRRLNRVFDVAEDHPSLIRSAMKRLEHDGTLIFSTNFRRFKLDPGISSEFQTEEITPLTIPPDFERSPHIHRCWSLRRAS